MNVLVTIGFEDGSGEGAIVHVDLVEGRARPWLNWTPPEPFRVARRGFTGASWGPGRRHLYVAGHCAVFRVEPRGPRVDGVLHQPSFADLHHVAATDDRLYVANTGIASVDVFDLYGRFVGTHGLLPVWGNARRMSGLAPDFDQATAPGWSGAEPGSWPPEEADGYRTTGPFHRSLRRDHLHLNHVQVHGTQILVTCLYDGTVRDLATLTTVRERPGVHPHDGQWFEGAVWMTTIDGRVVRTGAHASDDQAIDAFAAGPIGWCRGLLLGPNAIVVGLTQVRADRLPAHGWARRDPAATSTSVVAFDHHGRPLAVVDLTDPVRCAKIYSIVEAP